MGVWGVLGLGLPFLVVGAPPGNQGHGQDQVCYEAMRVVL